MSLLKWGGWLASFWLASLHAAEVTLLNVSYDPTREFYEAYNQAFSDYWHQKTGDSVQIFQSHGGSGMQARSVIEGLKADVVTLALAPDIQAIAKRQVLAADWESRLPNHATPFTSTIVFLVRKNNPKEIHDWPDLIKPGINVITPNPKTSGGARWNYMAAWGFALHHYGTEDKAKQYITSLFQHVKVLDSGARGATTSFVQRDLGDVLITWESDALMVLKEFGQKQYEIVYPSESIVAETPVARVDRVTARKGTTALADAYLQYLYSPQGQTIAAQHFYRPIDPVVAQRFTNQFPNLRLFTIREIAGSWSDAQQKHFAPNGIFDQIYQTGHSGG